MRKYQLLVILFLVSLSSYAQEGDFPIESETPRRGIYQTFEEFRFNIPGITDSFYVESKIRNQVNWEGTLSFTPRLAQKVKKRRRIWGFSMEGKVYVFHQLEYFEVKLDTTKVGFYGYKDLGPSGVIVGGSVGGAIGGGIYSAIAIKSAKKKRVYYQINLLNGKISPDAIDSNTASMEDQVAKLVIYRRGKKEKEAPLEVSIDGYPGFQLIPNTVKEIEVPLTREPLKVCYGDNLGQCIELLLISKGTRYLEASISTKSGETTLEQVNSELGTFNSKQAKYFQDKRENGGNKD